MRVKTLLIICLSIPLTLIFIMYAPISVEVNCLEDILQFLVAPVNYWTLSIHNYIWGRIVMMNHALWTDNVKDKLGTACGWSLKTNIGRVHTATNDQMSVSEYMMFKFLSMSKHVRTHFKCLDLLCGPIRLPLTSKFIYIA